MVIPIKGNRKHMWKLNAYLQQALQQRQESDSYRILPQPATGVDFMSNDYLGLATQGRLQQTIAQQYPHATQPGSTGSRLLAGNTVFAQQLEQKIALHHRAEAALLFNSGYDANVGLLSAIANKHTVIIYDEYCHASIKDGIRLSICKQKIAFKHNQCSHVSKLLEQYGAQHPVLIITESVFSMDGDIAPLIELAALATAHQAHLIVDEAHATGVFGPQGAGLVAHLGLETQVFARVHTYGKAMGCHGATVVGSTLLQQYLINFARSFVYTTALPLHSLYAIESAYSLLQQGGVMAPLQEVIHYYLQQTAPLAIPQLSANRTPIQTLVVGNNHTCKQISMQLEQNNLLAKAILSPTVRLGSERIRICLHSYNTFPEIDALLYHIREAMPSNL